MNKQVLVRRYGQGLVNTVRDEADFQKISAGLEELAGFFFSPGELRAAMANPFLVKNKKMEIASAILERAAPDPRLRNFILLLLEKGRFELLPDILGLLPSLWNEKAGRLGVDVVSAAPLSEAQKKRLRTTLETLEGRPVDLSFALDPELVAGLILRRGHVVYDLSLRGSVDRLRGRMAGG